MRRAGAAVAVLLVTFGIVFAGIAIFGVDDGGAWLRQLARSAASAAGWTIATIQVGASAISDFVRSNVGPSFTLLGAMIALTTARFVHYDRIRRESNERIRKLLGEYVAAVQSRQDARTILRRRRDFRADHSDVMDLVNRLKMKAPSPSAQALNARVADAEEEVRRAQSRVDSLLFQLSIAQGERQSELVFTAKLLEAAELDVEYANAYNFALSLAIHLFGDTRQERRRAGPEF